jgi:hypothetical protein
MSAKGWRKRQIMSIEAEHQPWCASLTRMLTCRPPKPAPCDCKTQCVEHGECFGGKCIYPQLNRDVATPREWVNATAWRGLTDEDWDYIEKNCGSIRSAIKTAEALLKEKNQ